MQPMTSNAHAIAETVNRLLNHLGTTNEHPAVRRAIAEDWISDLAEFTLAQVQWATREWRRTQSIRPTIAEIRTLATQAQHNDLKARAIADHRPGQVDAETLRMWERPEYDGDIRSPQQRRLEAVNAQEARYRRAAELRKTNPPLPQAAE